MSAENPSIGFLISSIGRITLNGVLRSLYGQFNWGRDKIKVYFDGRCDAGSCAFQETFELFNATFPDSLEFIFLEDNLGFWGHPVRNKYQSTFTTDYITHADDDDLYCEGVFHTIREDISHNWTKVLLYKIQADGGIVWKTRDLAVGNIATPCGIIYNDATIFGEWGHFYGGDAQFYKQIKSKIGYENFVWKDLIIYKTRLHI